MKKFKKIVFFSLVVFIGLLVFNVKNDASASDSASDINTSGKAIMGIPSKLRHTFKNSNGSYFIGHKDSIDFYDAKTHITINKSKIGKTFYSYMSKDKTIMSIKGLSDKAHNLSVSISLQLNKKGTKIETFFYYYNNVNEKPKLYETMRHQKLLTKVN